MMAWAILIITAQDITAVVSTVKAKNYPSPTSPVLNYISSNSLPFFKNRQALDGTTNTGVTLNTNSDPLLTTLTINAQQWQNVVAFETYNQKTLMDVAIFGTGDASLATTLVRYPANATSVYAVSFDGTRILVYPAVDVFDVLPVELISFEAKCTVQGALLSWKVASEQNNQKFEIYKKVGNADFEKIGERFAAVGSANGASYQFVDSRFTANAYYFIKQVDKDGASKNYDSQQWIRFVEADLNGATVIYPNPATTTVTITANSEKYGVKIMDANGRSLKETNSNGKHTTISVGEFAAGVYLVQIFSGTGVETRKLIKQ